MTMRRAYFACLDELDLSIPEKAQAAHRLRERDVIDVHILQRGQLRPRDDDGVCVVIDDAQLERYGTYDDLRLLLGPTAVIRGMREEPTVSEAVARLRGFSEREIDASPLRAWRQQLRSEADRSERAAQELQREADLARAQADADPWLHTLVGRGGK
jgi:hypothetical protein